jgi:hypothetical protein
MLNAKTQSSYTFGFIEKDGPDKESLSGKELFPEFLYPSTTIKSIKMWFGSPSGKTDIKALLGIQVKYINYITGERKETNYQGAPIEGIDFDVKELIIKEGDYLTKFNLGFDDYITHIKFTTKKGESIEFGVITENEKQSVNEINSKNYIILNIKGYSSKNGIRAIGVGYIPFKDFCFIRWLDLLRLRHMFKDEKYRNKMEKQYSNLNDGMKCVYRASIIASACLAKILSYL